MSMSTGKNDMGLGNESGGKMNFGNITNIELLPISVTQNYENGNGRVGPSSQQRMTESSPYLSAMPGNGSPYGYGVSSGFSRPVYGSSPVPG